MAREDILLVMKKEYVYKKLDLVECNISRNNRIMYDVRPSDCCVIAYVTLGKKFDVPNL